MIHYRLPLNYQKRGYILNAPKLQRLSMLDVVIKRDLSYFTLLFKNLTNLTHLDMSSCEHRDGMDEFKWLPKYLKNTLVYLVLHNVGELDTRAIKNIVKLDKLKHLDISMTPERFSNAHYSSPSSILKFIVQRLPDLSSLDISGTNLAHNLVLDSSGKTPEEGNIIEITESDSERIEGGEMPKCDISGLISRVDNPLDFLGLYKCDYKSNHRTRIPAKQVCLTLFARGKGAILYNKNYIPSM